MEKKVWGEESFFVGHENKRLQIRYFVNDLSEK